MTKADLELKMKNCGQDCTTCEFKVVPERIEPCRSCSDDKSEWTENKR